MRSRPRGQRRAVDEVTRLRAELDQERACSADLRRQRDEAQEARDKANAKANQLGEALARAVEATRQNQTAVSSLTAHPAVNTQPNPVLPLHLAPFASPDPAHVPGA
jgi:type II secretory pathway component PulM